MAKCNYMFPMSKMIFKFSENDVSCGLAQQEVSFEFQLHFHDDIEQTYFCIFYNNKNMAESISKQRTKSTVARLLHFLSQTYKNALCFSLCLPLVFIVFLATLMTICVQKSSNLATVTKSTNMKCVTLAKCLKPDDVTDVSKFSKGSAKSFLERQAKNLEAKEKRSRDMNRTHGVVRENVGDRTATLGSEESIYSNNADCGLFASVVTAYNKHWKLRTSPDDWWFVVARRVAIAIDKNSKKDAVRKMFVDHEGM